MSVRRAQPADAQTIGRLLYDFNTEYEEPTPDPQTIAQRVLGLMGDDLAALLAGGDEPDGLAVLRFRPSLWTQGLECYLAELYVVPQRRGQGIGRALMEAVIALARERGADYMEVNTSEDDVVARKLYQRFGFSRSEGKPDGPINFYYEREL
jgi:ribosomal protein S18 acetylase RimI-like enzyme